MRRANTHSLIALLALVLITVGFPAYAQQLGPRMIVTASDIEAAVNNSPLSPTLKQYAEDIGRLGIFESGGNLGVYNGTCCTGVLQVNRGGLWANCHCTPAQYASMSLQQQVNIWAAVTNVNANNGIIRGLMALGSFDGKPVDGAMILACIQIGPGHCAKTLAAGTCSTQAGADANGKNFCDFAANISSGSSSGVGSGSGSAVMSNESADFDLGIVLLEYKNLAGTFGNTLLTAARMLLFILITIDVVWMILVLILRGSEPQKLAIHLLVRAVWYGFLLLMISSDYLSALVLGFKALGEDASGLAVVTPGAVFWKGVDLISTITTNFGAGGLSVLTNPFVAFALGLSIILILLAYTVMTAQYVMILVQMYFYLAVAPLLLSFGALSHGRNLALKTISSAIVIGVRLMAIYFVLAVANGLAPTIGAELAVAGFDNMGPIWAVVGLSALLALLAIKVPTLASDILTGSASLSGSDMFAVGAMAGSAVTNGLTQVAGKYFGRLGSSAAMRIGKPSH
jgi:P-type conjugative transfer protein TrbL